MRSAYKGDSDDFPYDAVRYIYSSSAKRKKEKYIRAEKSDGSLAVREYYHESNLQSVIL